MSTIHQICLLSTFVYRRPATTALWAHNEPMSVPPRSPASRSLRRTPRTRLPDDHATQTRSARIEQAQGFARVALRAGAGDDVAALTSSARRSRFVLAGDALRIVAIALLAMALAVVTNLQTSILDQDEAMVQAQAVPAGIAETHSEPATSPDESNGHSDGESVEGNGASEIVVYVSGAVNQSGIVTIAAGGRVNDAVVAAGGFTEDANEWAINLAAVVADGEHIHIPAQGEEVATATESATAESGLVNINSASADELETIPGVGPVTAAAIIEWRETNGPFTSIEQLMEVSGIGERTLERLRDHVTV